MRIAPKPSRLTARSPPNFQTEFVAKFGVVDEVAPKIVADPPTNQGGSACQTHPKKCSAGNTIVHPFLARFRRLLCHGLTVTFIKIPVNSHFPSSPLDEVAVA